MTADALKPGRLDSCGRPIQLTEEQRTRPSGKDVAAWIAPEDMPDHMVLSVLAGVICGAKNPGGQGDATYCLSAPVKGIDRTKPSPWRCKSHGGIPESQARPGNTNGMTYGLYGDAMFEEEKALYLKTPADGMDDEIVMAKLRLRRALIAEKDAKFELQSYEEEETTTTANDEIIKRTKKKFANRSKLVDQITSQLARLYSLRTNRTMAILEATAEGVKVYLPDNGRDSQT